MHKNVHYMYIVIVSEGIFICQFLANSVKNLQHLQSMIK